MKLKPRLKAWVRALTNPHLLLCLAAAWFCTNGWAYCAAGFGYYLKLGWMLNVAMVYLGILWMPGTPEKLLTFGLAILFLKLWFPEDKRTLAMLRQKRTEIADAVRVQFQKLKEWWKSHRKNKGAR